MAALDSESLPLDPVSDTAGRDLAQPGRIRNRINPLSDKIRGSDHERAYAIEQGCKSINVVIGRWKWKKEGTASQGQPFTYDLIWLWWGHVAASSGKAPSPSLVRYLAAEGDRWEEISAITKISASF
jgi:hypothetical protein